MRLPFDMRGSICQQGDNLLRLSCKARVTVPMLNGPNFFIVGAPKCGTTAVYTYLSAHPEVFFPAHAKEPHYYNEDMPGFRWFTDRSDYLALFESENASVAAVRGEASVQYLYSKVSAAKIARDNPHARILICLRKPVHFIRSYHNQMLNNLDEDIPDLAQAWQRSGEVRAVARETSMLNYKAIGLFAQQIDRYRAVFPDTQIRLLELEEFVANPRGHYLALLFWLQLEDDGRVDFPPVHTAKTQRSRAIARFLKSPPPFIRRSVQALKRLAGVKSFGLAQKVQNLNAAQSYGTVELDAKLVRQIEDHYAPDQRALARHADLVLRPQATTGEVPRY